MRKANVSLSVCLLTGSLLLASGCGGGFTTQDVKSKPGTTTTIILVRHAERNEGLDPPLNAEGLVRAEKLADVLEQNGVTAIFCPDLIRNRQTCDAVADRIGVGVNVIPGIQLGLTKLLAQNVVADILENHAGGVVLWVGNTGPVFADQSGNLQEIYDLLGGTGDPPIRYQDLFIVNIPDEGGARFVKAEYGGPSSLD